MYKELMTKIGINSPLMGLVKLDQIAFAAYSKSDELEIKQALKLDEADWVEDEVIATGTVYPYGFGQTNKAKLLFNYDYGVEIEILRYLEGNNYLKTLHISPRSICHIGFHVNKGMESDPRLKILNDMFIVQKVETSSHTNPFLKEAKRKYRYTIYDTTANIGVCVKIIERLENKDGQ